MGRTVRRDEHVVISGQAIGGDPADLPAEVQAMLGLTGTTGITNLGGTVRVTDTTVNGRHVDDAILRPGDSL